MQKRPENERPSKMVRSKKIVVGELNEPNHLLASREFVITFYSHKMVNVGEILPESPNTKQTRELERMRNPKYAQSRI
jgi:hypothetical protein